MEQYLLIKELLVQLKKEYKELYENGKDDDSYRFCTECDDVMNEGYMVDNGQAYYCSDECLHKNMTAEEWNELANDIRSESYYTAWEG